MSSSIYWYRGYKICISASGKSHWFKGKVQTHLLTVSQRGNNIRLWNTWCHCFLARNERRHDHANALSKRKMSSYKSLHGVGYSTTVTFLLEEFIMILGSDHICRLGGFWSGDLWNISSGQILYDATRFTQSLLSADCWPDRDPAELL